VCERETYLRLGNCLRAHGVSRGNGFKLYNSGLCGVNDNDASLLEQAIERIDEWTEGGFDIHTIEQIAISFTLRNQTIRKTDRHVYHYFGHKQFFHTMHAHFFAQHGETFDAQLIERSRDVPRSRPLPPIWRRLKIKWQLRNQRGAFYRIGRDLLYGSEAPQNPYFNLCRHHWWDSASREINRLEPERRKKSFGQLEQWPQQMPAPSRAQDKSLILAQLNRQVTPSA
jgi:hypothetical protein